MYTYMLDFSVFLRDNYFFLSLIFVRFFFIFFLPSSILLELLLKVTKVTTKHQNWPKIAKKHTNPGADLEKDNFFTQPKLDPKYIYPKKKKHKNIPQERLQINKHD